MALAAEGCGFSLNIKSIVIKDLGFTDGGKIHFKPLS